MSIKQDAIRNFRLFLSILCLVLLCPQSSFATREFRYRTVIVDVVDGDNVVVSNRVFVSGYELRINNVVPLDGVDAPGLGEQGGKEARDALAELVLGKKVNV